MRFLPELVLALGAIYLAGSFAVPLALVAAALKAFEAKNTAWGGGFAAAAVVAGIVLIPPFFQTVEACQNLQQQIKWERTLDSIFKQTRVTQNELEYVQRKCDDIPFV